MKSRSPAGANETAVIFVKVLNQTNKSTMSTMVMSIETCGSFA